MKCHSVHQQQKQGCKQIQGYSQCFWKNTKHTTIQSWDQRWCGINWAEPLLAEQRLNGKVPRDHGHERDLPEPLMAEQKYKRRSQLGRKCPSPDCVATISSSSGLAKHCNSAGGQGFPELYETHYLASQVYDLEGHGKAGSPWNNRSGANCSLRRPNAIQPSLKIFPWWQRIAEPRRTHIHIYIYIYCEMCTF